MDLHSVVTTGRGGGCLTKAWQQVCPLSLSTALDNPRLLEDLPLLTLPLLQLLLPDILSSLPSLQM